MNQQFRLKYHPLGVFSVFENEKTLFRVSGNVKGDEFQLNAIDTLIVYIDDENLLKHAFRFFENYLRSEHGCSKITGKFMLRENNREGPIRKSLDLLESLDFQIQYEDGPEIQVKETRVSKGKYPLTHNEFQSDERTHKYWTVKIMKELN
jgi:hypothetical protein